MLIPSFSTAPLSRTTPESVGISSRNLIRVLDELQHLDSLHSIMILRHGKVCMEGWWAPFAPENPHILFSLSKSFTSIAIGLAQKEGLLKITDPLTSFFPEYKAWILDSRMNQVTLRDLLTMASGHRMCARSLMLADPEGDWVRGFLSSELDFEPGSRFVYNSGATYMLSAVLHKVTGINIREYLLPRLFEPLGITPGMWECCPKGINKGGWGLYLRTEDIAKFAQLLLNKGVWNKQQLIPADYLQAATSKQIDNSQNQNPDWKLGYGYQFWISQYGFRGDGAAGQYAVVLPEQDMAVAVTSGVSDMQRILTIFWNFLLPVLNSAPLPEDQAARKELCAILNALSVPVSRNALTHQSITKTWTFLPNKAGITDALIHCDKENCRLTFHSRHGVETILAGFGCNRKNVLQLNDHLPRRIAASAGWRSETVLEIRIYSYEASFRDIFRIDFESPDKPLVDFCSFSTFREPFLPDLTARYQ